MAQKNGNAVAVERRADLASLFCMIGRHGPAVALAVAAVVSVLAAFLIYRTVRGKRRKAAAGAERDAPATRPEREPIPEESLGSVESTDVSDEGSSDTKEADDVIPSRPKIRLRRVPADENKPPPRSPSETDIQPPDYKHFTSDDTQAFQADYQENERVTRDEDVSDEENLQCGSNNLMNSEGSNLEAGTGSINCYGKDKQFEEENHPDNINYNNCSSNNQLCVEEEKNKGVDNEISTTDQDINGDDDGGLAVTSEILDEYHKCTAAKFTTHPPLLDKQEIDAQTSGVVNVLDKEDEIKPPLDKNIDVDVLHFDLLSVKKEIKDEKNETVALADKTIDGKLQHAGQNASNKESKKSSDEKTSVAAAPKADENVTASVVTEDSVLVRPSICQDRQSEHMENYETFDVTRVHSDDAAVCDKAAITPAVTSEKISHPDMPSPFQDQQSDQIQNKDLFYELTVGAADVRSPVCKVNLLSFEQSELRDRDKDGRSPPGAGEESGISSMTVSPDLQDDCNGFNITNTSLPEMDRHPQPEERTETQSNLLADDVALSFSDNSTECLATGPYPSHVSQKPHAELIDWTANEDVFGREIEENYHGALEQFMAEIAESVTSFTDELKVKTGIRSVVEVKEIRKGVTAERKGDAESETEKEDNERTEISIMEATMDNNEWIMDSNYQVLPWINVSVPSFAQDIRQTDHPPSQQNQHSSSLPDATCIDTDSTLSTEVKQTNHLSLADDGAENGKKVLAVQPMPQNVNVTFRIHYLTHSPYQTVAVTGNLQELGNWREFVPLERAKDGHWATVISLPAESHVEWKFVVVDKGQVCRWEECGNRMLDTGYGDDLVVHKWWGFL